ncbi:unnamed protein product, partial [Laminaria digitata]
DILRKRIRGTAALTRQCAMRVVYPASSVFFFKFTIHSAGRGGARLRSGAHKHDQCLASVFWGAQSQAGPSGAKQSAQTSAITACCLASSCVCFVSLSRSCLFFERCGERSPHVRTYVRLSAPARRYF